MVRNRRKLMGIIAAVLCLTLLVPSNVFAAQQEVTAMPLASSYIASCSVGLSALGSGDIAINCVVGGVGTMGYIGVKNIVLYESTDDYNYFAAEVFEYDDYPNMMGTGKASHSSRVTFDGTVGYYYQAMLNIYAGSSLTTGDTITVWTEVKKAT